MDCSFDENIGTRLKNTIELANTNLHLKIDDEKISTKELEELFEKIGTKRQKFLLNFQRKNLNKDITSYNLEGKDEENYNEIVKEEESKLKINNNDIFEKLKMRITEKK